MPTATVAPAKGKPAWMSGFEGSKRFFAAVIPAKHGEKSVYPFEHRSYMGVTFQRGTQKLIPVGGDENWFLDMAPPEPGAFIEIRSAQVSKMLAKIASISVRWLGQRIKDGKKSPPRRAIQIDARQAGNEELQDGDEPMARYLVFIPAEEVEKYGGRENAAKMPSLLDLNAELSPLRNAG